MTEERVHTLTGAVTFPNEDGIARLTVYLLREHTGDGFYVSAEAYVEERLETKYSQRPVNVERPLFNGITQEWVGEDGEVIAENDLPAIDLNEHPHGYSDLGIGQRTGIYINGDDVGQHVLPPLDLRYRMSPDGSIAPAVTIVIRGGHGLRDTIEVTDIPGPALLAPADHWERLNRMAPWNAAVHPFENGVPRAAGDQPVEATNATPGTPISASEDPTTPS